MNEKFYNIVEASKVSGISRYTLTKLIQKFQFADWSDGKVFVIGKKKGLRYAISKSWLDDLMQKRSEGNITTQEELNKKNMFIALDSLINFCKKYKIKTVKELQDKLKNDAKAAKKYFV